MGETPFDTVLIHGIIRDAQGRKMSKSLGNGVDPLEVIDEYGADALRFMLVTGNAPGNDIRYIPERVEAARNFANKIWNASRFVMMNLDRELMDKYKDCKEYSLADQWILSRMNSLIKEVTENMEKYELGIALQKVHDFLWTEFCDYYIELVKPVLYGDDEKAKGVVFNVLYTVLNTGLKLLHPVMPFITCLLYTSSIAGTEEHVKGFKRKQIYDFYKKYYTPDNCVIVTVSAFSHEQMQKIITDLFGKWEGKSHKKAKIIKEENKDIVKTTYKSQIEQGTVTYLYAFKEVCEKDKLPLKILSYKLAESSNSILFRDLREERGLAYDVYSQMDLDENVNTMNIFTSVREESIDEVIEVIDKAILDIKNKNINFDEDMLCMMKKTHKTGVVSTLEDCSSLCSYVLVQSLAGKDITEFINSMEELETLTGEDIYRVCNKYLNKPTIHILKPME